jgi:hypothetical protein
MRTTATGEAPGVGDAAGADGVGSGVDEAGVDAADGAEVGEADGAADGDAAVVAGALGCRLAAGAALQATTKRNASNAKIGRAGSLVMAPQTRGTRFGSRIESGSAGRGLVRAAAAREANQVLVQLEPCAVVAVDAR